MIDIVTYITEGGFFANTGANKYVDIIKNFGKILADEATQEELNTAKWPTNMPNTNVFKQLYDVFNDIITDSNYRMIITIKIFSGWTVKY